MLNETKDLIRNRLKVNNFMNFNVNGKSFKEWIEEMKNGDGAVTIHHAKQRMGNRISTFSGSVVSYNGDKDVYYEDADISVSIDGHNYRLKGNRVECINKKWYVDGKLVNFHDMEEDLNVDDNTGRSAKQSVCYSEESPRNNKETVYGDTVIHNTRSRTINTGRRTIITGGSVNIKRGGKSYTIKGNKIERCDGQWYADGKAVDCDDLGGEYEDRNVVSIEITGQVENLYTTSGNVTVNGNVGRINTGSGDVKCDTANTISTGSGDVECDVANSVSTGSGDVHCDCINGSVSTCSGDIYK